MIDTKAFYDICREEGIDFKTASPEDTHYIAMQLVMGDPEFLELHVDWISDMLQGMDPTPREESYRQRWATTMERADRNLDLLMRGVRASEGTISTFATSYVVAATDIGEMIIVTIQNRAEKYVDANIEEWFGDAAAYDYEMEQCAKEDYYDGLREERLLEKRHDDL